MLKSLILTASILAVSIPASAREVTIGGVGAGGCETWLNIRAQARSSRAGVTNIDVENMLISWVQGYLSGVAAHSADYDPFAGPDSDKISLWLDGFCGRLPASALTRALDLFAWDQHQRSHTK